MTHRIELPKGDWADIREADEVPERLRRAYLEAQTKMLQQSGASVSDEGKVDMSTLNVTGMASEIGPVRDALILCYTKAWSLLDGDNPLPLNAESILDLPGGAYDALHDACDKAYKEAKGGQVDTSPEGALDPRSPTEPLAG